MLSTKKTHNVPAQCFSSFSLIWSIQQAIHPSISINTIMNFLQIQHLLSVSFLAQRSQKASAKNIEEQRAVAAVIKSKSILNLCESPAYECEPCQLSCSWLLIPGGLVSAYILRIHSALEIYGLKQPSSNPMFLSEKSNMLKRPSWETVIWKWERNRNWWHWSSWRLEKFL